MTNEELREALDDFGDHLTVVVVTPDGNHTANISVDSAVDYDGMTCVAIIIEEAG